MSNDIVFPLILSADPLFYPFIRMNEQPDPVGQWTIDGTQCCHMKFDKF